MLMINTNDKTLAMHLLLEHPHCIASVFSHRVGLNSAYNMTSSDAIHTTFEPL